MFRTIAWATDGSASASDALEIAEDLTRAIGGKLAIIHVQEVTISRSGFLTEDNRAVLASLHRTARRLQDDGVHATVLSSRTTTRNVPRKILDLVATAHADVLIIGNRGHGSVINFLLGSVATRLLKAAPLPIITVPSRSTAATPLTDAGIASDSARSGTQPAQPGQPLSHLRADSASHVDTRTSGHPNPGSGHHRPHPARR
ncbi:universal stress protein [Actinoplanes sp. NPDC048791]|uniref:universal stress protein n=1 Tax=Actinoplanes sp. NPDC048791 TaxID=3154623 RepID=UPI0033C29980